MSRITLAALALVLGGCCSPEFSGPRYWTATDPGTGRMYYTVDSIRFPLVEEQEPLFIDAETLDRVDLPAYELTRISYEQFRQVTGYQATPRFSGDGCRLELEYVGAE